MIWSIPIPAGTAARSVFSVVRRGHEDLAAAALDGKGLLATEEDQVGAAVRAIHILWTEVAVKDAGGNYIGTVTGSLSGQTDGTGRSITVSLQQE